MAKTIRYGLKGKRQSLRGKRRARVSTEELHAAPASTGSSIGINAEDTVAVVKKVRTGLPYRSLAAFQKSTGLPMEAVAGMVRIAPRTLSRRKSEGRLQPGESDRLVRVATIFEKTVRLFDGDVQAARNWLSTPQKALADETPWRFAETDVGAREVEYLIGRLEHGVFT